MSPNIKESVRLKMKEYKDILPESPLDRVYWSINAFMSVVEELIYRGLILFYLPYFFPEVNIVYFILLSLTADAVRYVSRTNALGYVLFTSSMFIMTSLIYNSIYPAIVLHVLQDLRVLFMPIDFDNYKNYKTEELI